MSELISASVTDEHPRVRLEALRSLSFVPSLDAIELAWKATSLPVDYWISYTLAHTVGALQPVWEPTLKDGSLAQRNPAAAKYLTDYGLAAAPGTQAQAIIDRLLSSRTSPKDKEAAYEQLTAMKGDATNGKALFGRTCLNCHIVEGKGFEYGPNLSDVAKRLKFRDIIESIIDPNAKLDVKYQATLILTDKGKIHTGLLTAEDADSVTLKVAATVGKDIQTVRIEKSSIEERQILKQSSMPEGLAGAFSPLDFLDLLAYLKTLETPPPPPAAPEKTESPSTPSEGEPQKSRLRKKMKE
jgi:putative heme-binding domain-containing protein